MNRNYKNYLFCLLTAFITIYGCKKDTAEPDIFRSEVSLRTIDDVYAPVMLDFKKDRNYDYLFLTINNEPEHIDILPNPDVFYGDPPFVTTLHIVARNATPGKHIINITASINGKNTENFYTIPVTLNIREFNPGECNDYFYNHAMTANAPPDSNPFVSARISTYADTGFGYRLKLLKDEETGELFFSKLVLSFVRYTENEVSITGLTDGTPIPIVVDCSTEKISIPEQEIKDTKGNTYTLKGEGKFSRKDRTINMTYVVDTQHFFIKAPLF